MRETSFGPHDLYPPKPCCAGFRGSAGWALFLELFGTVGEVFGGGFRGQNGEFEAIEALGCGMSD